MAAIPGARLSAGLLVLMLAQSTTGLLLPGQYRDVDWIKVTWVGNDSVTLVVGVPLLLGGIVLAKRGSVVHDGSGCGAVGERPARSREYGAAVIRL